MWWHLWYLHTVKNHLFSFYVKLYGGYRFFKLILPFHVLLCTYVSFGRKMVHAVIFRICTLFATWHINKVGSKTELHFLSLPGQEQRPWKEIRFYPSWRKYTWCFFVASISQSTANISFYTLDGHSMSVCSTLSFLLGRPSELIMSTEHPSSISLTGYSLIISPSLLISVRWKSCTSLHVCLGLPLFQPVTEAHFLHEVYVFGIYLSVSFSFQNWTISWVILYMKFQVNFLFVK